MSFEGRFMCDDGEILEDTGDFLSTPFTSTYDPATWENVCDDFLDPLADQLDRWVGRRPSHEAADVDVVHWIEELTYIVHAIATGVGSQDDCRRWNRTKTELAIEVSVAFAEKFETRAKGLFDAANAAVDEFSTCRPEYASAVVDGLVCVDVEEFCEYCRNCSQRLRKRLRDGDNSPDGPGNGGSKASKPKVKKGPGRPAKSDPKADKRIWDAWKTRAYNNYRELANELGREVKEVGLAIDRQRKREATETAFPDSRSGSSGGWNPED